jgi:hypothetical protein
MANLFQQDLTDELINSYYKNSNIGMSNIGMSYNDGMSNIGMSYNDANRQASKDINRLIEHMELLVNGNNKAEANDKPLGFLTSFFYPEYQSITMQTLVDDDVNPSESHYVTLVDKEGDSNDSDSDSDSDSEDETVMPRDTIAQLYFASLGVLGLFILYRLMQKSR